MVDERHRRNAWGFAARPGEGARLRALERARLAGERKGDEGDDIGHERQDDAADQRVRRERDQRGGAQPGDRERPVREIGGRRLLRLDRGQKQEIDPGERAGVMPAMVPRAVPRRQNKPAEKGRGDLRDGGEGEKPDRDEPRLAGDPLVERSRAPARRRSRAAEPTARARRCRLRRPLLRARAAAAGAASRGRSRW